MVDDTDQTVAYAGDWSTASEVRYLQGGCHVGTTAGGSLETTFVGTRVDWYGLKNVDLGKADVYVDGALLGAGIDLYDPKRQNAQLFTLGGLAAGAHTIKVEVTGEKNPASSGTALVHDYFIAYVDP